MAGASLIFIELIGQIAFAYGLLVGGNLVNNLPTLKKITSVIGSK